MAALLRRRNNHMGSLPLACLRGTFDFNPPGPREKFQTTVCAPLTKTKHQAAAGQEKSAMVSWFSSQLRLEAGGFCFPNPPPLASSLHLGLVTFDCASLLTGGRLMSRAW